MFYAQLVNIGKWTKKKAPKNALAFAGNQNNSYSRNQNTKASNGHADKYNKSLSSNNKYTTNGMTYSWCTGPGHVHAPGTCEPIEAQNKPAANAVQAGNAQGSTNMKKSTFEKKIAMFPSSWPW